MCPRAPAYESVRKIRFLGYTFHYRHEPKSAAVDISV